MSKEILVFFVIFMYFLSQTLAARTTPKPTNVEHKIEHMRARVMAVKADINTIINRFEIIAENQPTFSETVVSILKNVSYELTEHFKNEEKEARKAGAVLHNQPELAVLTLIISHNREYSQKIERALMDEPVPDNETKLRLLKVMQRMMNLAIDCYTQYINEITMHPKEWDSVDPVLNWKFLTNLESDVYDEKTSEAILRMQNIMNNCKTQLRKYQTDYVVILAQYRSKLFDMAEVALDTDTLNEM